MKKLFYIVVLVVTFDWLFNANRSLLNGSLRVAGNIGSEMETRRRMESVSMITRVYYQYNHKLPVGNLETVIRAYLTVHHITDASITGKDAWGTLFHIDPCNDELRFGFYVVSAGPDREWGTKDDLKQHFSLEEAADRAAR